jgi:hypothetical protein
MFPVLRNKKPYIDLPPSVYQKKESNSRIARNQMFSCLTKFISKDTNIYDTKINIIRFVRKCTFVINRFRDINVNTIHCKLDQTWTTLIVTNTIVAFFYGQSEYVSTFDTMSTYINTRTWICIILNILKLISMCFNGGFHDWAEYLPSHIYVTLHDMSARYN